MQKIYSTGEPMLIVANEVSGAVSVWGIDVTLDPREKRSIDLRELAVDFEQQIVAADIRAHRDEWQLEKSFFRERFG
jgi:hypothetical protein